MQEKVHTILTQEFQKGKTMFGQKMFRYVIMSFIDEMITISHFKLYKNHDVQLPDTDFLFQVIEKELKICEITKDILLLKQSDRTEYKIEQLRGNQRDIFDHIFMKLKNWMKLHEKSRAMDKKLAKMIVRGQSGLKINIGQHHCDNNQENVRTYKCSCCKRIKYNVGKIQMPSLYADRSV